MNRFSFITIILLICLCIRGNAQSAIVRDFTPACDSLDVLIQERHDIESPKLKLSAVMKRGNSLDFYFTQELSDCPWREGDPTWFRRQLRSLFPDKYSSYSLGKIYTRRLGIEDLVTPVLGFDGQPSDSKHSVSNPSRRNIVTDYDGLSFSHGLSGRHIAVWQSHGRYFDRSTGVWDWQRPCLFQTVEDMFTQSFVLQYLVPMLENAGAYVLLPRERDIQRNEVIADNDENCGARGHATYEERGKWSDAGKGFADLKETYSGIENPFSMGSARKASCIDDQSNEIAPEIRWRPDITERGRYAVYVSYKSLPESTESAGYEVHHMGGISRFVVNQKMGGGTWIYLGTFEFDEGNEGYVVLTSRTPYGYRHDPKAVVTADAVRFGGGMGNIACGTDEIEAEVSGMARSAEGARYWMQWAGVSPDIFSQNEGEDDYRDDFMSRGDWVEWISRGSEMNPKKTGGLGIPVDLALGFHSDAGVTPGDSIVGTLAIYTYRSEGSTRLPDGGSRMGSREFADMVQSQTVNDIRNEFEPEWSRRWIWDRSYRESRTPSCPSMLLELLSHQNFADMKYGLDPSFRFTVGRAVYKGMLKYLSNRYGCPYIVQPLPVSSVGVSFGHKEQAVITWTPVMDKIEPTAAPEGFMLYTRIDDGGFDNGRIIKAYNRNGGKYTANVDIKPGHIYSFRIAAFNDGGISFPSETVSIGMPSSGSSNKKVLIVNNFDRISGPVFVDSPEYAGFDNRSDSGVPYINDIAYVGDMYQFRREVEFQNNDNPGFGGSFEDMAGEIIAGNTFDYPYIHGKAIMNAGYPFYSCSNETFSNDSTFRMGAWTADIICGKQVTTVAGSGNREKDYTVFPAQMQKAITEMTADGSNILVSGSYIATDIWDKVYPIDIDSTFRESSINFAQSVLGYKWSGNSGSRKGTVRQVRVKNFPGYTTGKMEFHNTANSERYSVESPDGLIPSGRRGAIIMRYSDTGTPAAICHNATTYRTACFGFPLETLKNEEDINRVIKSTLEYFEK